MTANTTRLDRFIRQNTAFAISDTRLLLAQGRIVVDGELAQSISQRVDRFSRVEVDGLCLQADTPLYVALNKPKGVVSATKDDAHRTVMDVLDHPRKAELLIVGSQDKNLENQWVRVIGFSYAETRRRIAVFNERFISDGDVFASFRKRIIAR